MSSSRSDKETLQQEREKLHVNLLSSVSHDLKTPLASIIGSLEIHQNLKNILSDERKDTLINTAIEEAHRLDDFITNIIDMSKFEQGITLRYEQADISNIVQQAARQVQERSGRVIHTELLPNVIAQVNATWIQRALLLMLKNAVHYTPENIAITVSVSSDTKFFRISVRDYGAGIAKKLLPTLFEKHSRTERKDNTLAGTGLGLPICKAIAQAHGGSILVELPQGGGTVFTLCIPLCQPSDEHKKAPI